MEQKLTHVCRRRADLVLNRRQFLSVSPGTEGWVGLEVTFSFLLEVNNYAHLSASFGVL